MCNPTRCRTCGKPTWSGCGAHVARVKARVPADQWCPGHRDDTHTGPSWLRRIPGQNEGTR
ncbi:hypothetical protein LP418_05220 [Nocardioides sp. B-3]|nr:hypothetical protein [Nocardioides sp. B-3]UUZ60326.1 hypothetical protein LP418_05220 [Nocardioides sp. B-3]